MGGARGMTGCALRAAIASWHLHVTYAPSAVTHTDMYLALEVRFDPLFLRAFHSPSPSTAQQAHLQDAAQRGL